MEPWENDLRKAFADFEPEVSEEHWKAVMAKRQPSRRTTLTLFWRVAASVALLLAVVWVIRWGASDQDAIPSATARRNEKAHGAPASTRPAENQPAMAHRIQEETIPAVPNMDKQPDERTTRKQIQSPKAMTPKESAIASRDLVSQQKESFAIPDQLSIPDRLAQKGQIDRAIARIILPVTQDQPTGAVSTPFWQRLRQLPLFQPSENTLPERTAETWAMLQPESLHRLQEMARRPTTIEIVW